MRAPILAAGRGTRLGLDGDRPKCLATVGGRTLLDYYLDALTALSVPTMIGIGRGATHVDRHVAERSTPPVLVHARLFQVPGNGRCAWGGPQGVAGMAHRP